MSDPELPKAAPADDAETKPSAAVPEQPSSAGAGPTASDGPVWAQGLAIVVIVTAASAYLLSDREQEPNTEARPASSTEARPAPKARPAPVEEPEPPEQMAEPEDVPAPVKAPAPASASPGAPAIERAEPTPE